MHIFVRQKTLLKNALSDVSKCQNLTIINTFTENTGLIYVNVDLIVSNALCKQSKFGMRDPLF